MRFFTVKIIVILFQVLFMPCGACFADLPLTDPVIPNGEKITYTVTIDKDGFPLVQRTVQKTENGLELYEIVTESRQEDLKVRIDREKMSVVYSRAKRKRPEFIVEVDTTIIKNEFPTKADELVLIDFSGINQILRGFPFGTTRSLRIRTALGGDFAFILTATRETQVQTAKGSIRCYELELGLEGLLGVFFPKTYFWYSMNAPHFLVRYEGQSGAPGSPRMTVELVDYRIE